MNNLLGIPCPHESGQVKDHSEIASDCHPLSDNEIKELLDLASRSNNGRYLSQIQVRLNQMNEVDLLFVERYSEGGTPELVEEFSSLLNWD